MAAAITDEIYQGLAMVDTLQVISQESAANAKRERSRWRKSPTVSELER